MLAYRQWCLLVTAIASKSNLNKCVVEKEMKIIGLTIHGFHCSRSREKKGISKLDRIIDMTLLEAAVKNPEVLAQIVNKYGEIRVRPDDEIAALAENMRAKVHKKAAQSILESHKHVLVTHVGELIDTVMGLNSVPGRRQHEERRFEGTPPGEQNGMSNIARQQHGMRRSCKKTSADPSVLIRGLAMLAVIEGIFNQQRKKQTRGSLEE